jgi:fatty acid desaturase
MKAQADNPLDEPALAQSYAPFRTGLLTAAELRALTRLRPAVVVRDTMIRWLIILAAWAVAAVWPHPGVVLVCMVIVGVTYYGLLIIGHDGLHRRLFTAKDVNDRFNDLLILGPIGAVTRLNRRNHMDHHHVTCLPNDPDRHKYTHDGKEPFFPFIFFLLGASNFVTTIANIFNFGKAGSRAKPADAYNAVDLVIIGGWQVALVAGLTLGVGWWAYPVLWLAPVYLFAYRADLTRVFCEHAMLTTDEVADASMRLISFRSSWLERQFFAPQNMNHHIPHHLWPSIPYYHLPAADALIRKSAEAGGPGADERLHWRASYLGFLWAYAAWRRTQRRGARAPAASAVVG